MRNIFNSIQLRKPKTNVFDLSHDVKLSLDMGKLVPILVQEAVPGDKFKVSCESMLRLAPMVAPVMHNVNVFTHFFFVPNRLTWPNWERFITGGEDGTASPAFPKMGAMNWSVGTLADYLGLPQASSVPTGTVSALPFAAYQLIYENYYRDQNLQSSVWPSPLSDGNQNSSATTRLGALRTRSWEHDYFTASLPFAQKGPAVTLPMGSFNDVDVYLDNQGYGYNQRLFTEDGLNIPDGTPLEIASGGTPIGNFTADTGAGARQVNLDPNGSLKADTSSLVVNATTINELRRATKLQEWLERNARGGSRYVENILSHFGIHAGDYRLDRPEYLGGSKNPVMISEVLQTSQTTTGTGASAQATMAGHGLATTSGRLINYKCKEHGYIIGIMSVMPKTAYQQGIPRHYLKDDRMRYYWPSFAHLGEQEVLNKELYFAVGDGDNDKTFGYVPRYAEYKFNPSRVAGEFRTSLAFWHMGRIFSARPNLNSSFIEADPTPRIFAVTAGNNNKIYAHVFHKITAIRPMPKFGTPML